MSVPATGGSTLLAYADKYEALALTRDYDGLRVLRLPHRRRHGRVLPLLPAAREPLPAG